MKFGYRFNFAAALFTVATFLGACGALVPVDGCASDPNAIVHTSTGDRTASTVWSQDLVGDALAGLKLVQADAVAKFEMTKDTMNPVDRQARFVLLARTGNGIKAGYDALLGWKNAAPDSGPAQVASALKPFARDLLALARESKVLKPELLNILDTMLGSLVASRSHLRDGPTLALFCVPAGGLR